MNWSILVFLLASSAGPCCSFLRKEDLASRPDLQGCYQAKYGLVAEQPGGRRPAAAALSVEALVALVERLEAARPASDTARRLLAGYRIDSLANWDAAAFQRNRMERALFGIREGERAAFQDELAEEERCALHFALSHALNFTALGPGHQEELDDKGYLKHPRESGVVSLRGKLVHAVALDRVLLGIVGGFEARQVDGADICRALQMASCKVAGVKVNPLFAATLGDLTMAYLDLLETNDKEKNLQENGKWNDLSCPNEYILNENVGKNVLLTNAMVRGAVDGLYIGYHISKNLELFRNVPLSQILRMYYGRTGQLDRQDINWCTREQAFSLSELNEEILQFCRLYMTSSGSSPPDDISSKIDGALKDFQTPDGIFNEVKEESESCSSPETTAEKCTTPFDIFAVLDWRATEQQRNFQIEVIGNLSSSFDIRPRGSSVAVFRNSRSPGASPGLEVLANRTQAASACSACFIRYVARTSTQIPEVEVFEKLNQTLTSFVEAYDFAQSSEGENNKAGAPSKVILYFNYGSPTRDYKLGEAVWEIEKNFQETTVLAIGAKRDALNQFVQNEETDVFTESSNAAAFVTKLKGRLCKAPAEFQYKDCQHPSQFSSSESSQEAVIGLNKRQYWAMYPKYFLKSFGITMKFKPQDGAKIKVCFTRAYYRLVGENAQYLDCKESTGEDLTFHVTNPCYRRSVHNCDPFYFLVEGKQVSSSLCLSPRCNTPRDIQFEFQHEGIACSTASFFSVSMLSLFFAGLVFILHRH